MVSRYGIAKEGAVGVAVGVGPMHCLLPHCGGPHHHLSPHHPQNPNHNHAHTHNHQPPPSQQPLSPHGPHIGQMNHSQHQLTINIGHHHPQQQQQQTQGQHQQPPTQYRIVSTNARSEFHVPGQNYGAQPGGQVGGGGGSIGVPTGRAPSLGGIGQSTAGIQSGGQQQPPQPPTPGVQQQQPQGPTPTTTPPVHTPSPQDMSKQGHLQTQPPSLQQQFVPNQPRPVIQTFYQGAQRQTQPRNMHRGNQGGTQHVVPIPNVATSTGQPPAMYQQNIAVPGTSPMYVPGPVSNLPQAPMYSVNSHIQPLLSYPQQRHPTHQSPPFYPGYPPHAILPQNVYGAYATGYQSWNFYHQPHTPPNSSMNLNRASSNPVSGGGQNVGGPLVGAQGTAGVPPGTLQQQQQPPQPLPQMAMSLQQPTYPGHSRSAQTPVTTYQKMSTRAHAILDIVNPNTGENVAGEIYRTAAEPEEMKPRETPQPQNSAIAADFASRVAKAASESGDNPPSVNIQEHNHTTASSTANLTNVKPLINSNKEPINDPGNNAPVAPVQSNRPRSPNLDSHLAPEICQVKVESKPAVPVAKEWQRNETKQQGLYQDEHQSSAPLTNKDNISRQQSSPIPPVVSTESETESSIAVISSLPAQNESTAPQLPKEPFSSMKGTSSSPPRRKPHQVQQNIAPVMSATTTAIDSPAAILSPLSTSTSEPIQEQERDLGEKNLSPKDTTARATSKQTEQHQHSQRNGETTDKSEEIKVEQKSPDGKGNQKQKTKKPKGRDLNRKGAEKEGTDMDAFSVPQPVKMDVKIQHDHLHGALSIKAVSSVETRNESSVRDKGTPEIKPDTEVESTIQVYQEAIKSETIKESSELQQSERIVQNHTDTNKQSTPTIAESNKSSMVADECVNDVVDHANMADVSDVEAIVAQKNEENTKVSGLPCSPNETKTALVIDKHNENEPPNQSVTKSLPQLKYQYDDDQWSPKNIGGKKRYGRDLLMKLQEDPKSRVRPPNLLDLEVVLKDSTRQPMRNAVDLSVYKGNRTHETLFPGFAKSSFNAKLPPPPNKKSYQGSKKPPKPNVIHVSLSLRADVKLRETENAWKPARLKSEMLPGEEAKSQALYKKVRSVLNKLTPQKFKTLVNQVRALDIDTQERLQGVIDLVFEKAVDEPSFSVAYALMCKELSGMKVSTGEKTTDEATGKTVDIYVDFRKLLIGRCQMEFEKHMVDESARAAKVQEIENTTDPEKKKELQFNLFEEDRRIRMKSVGNIRFVGELYKQDMIVAKIMHACIVHLLTTPDEENLECLCKLLSTVGKTLEPKSEPTLFPGYFTQLTELSSKKSSKKISSRVRFMIQDVIDLRAGHWIPRRDDSNPKTMDQIQKEAESERLEIQMNNTTPINTPRKDDRNNDRRRNRGGGGGSGGGGGGSGGGGSEDGWTVAPLGKTSRQPYSVEASKLNAKSLPLDEIKLGNRNAYLFGGSAAAAKPTTLGTPNKYAALENLEQDKQRVTPQLPGSRSTGAREYGRSDQYKGWDGRGSRNGGHINSSSMSSSREGSLLETSRSQSVSMPTQSMKYKPTSMMLPSNPVSSKPAKTEEQLNKIIRVVLDMCNGPQTDAFITDAVDTAKEHFDNSTYPLFVRETFNSILEKPSPFRQRFSALYAHMINNNMIPLSLFQSEYEKFLEIADDLVIDIPKCWTYFAEVLSEMIRLDAHPLAELKKTTAVLKSAGSCGKLVGELLNKLAKDLGPKVVADKWDQYGLRLADLVDTSLESPDDIVLKYKLEFLTSDCIGTEKSSGAELTLDQIHKQLVNLMRGSHFDNITGWISANVSGRSKQPQFIRVLVTAILEVSMETIPAANPASWKLNSEVFKSLLPLITRYVDTEPHLELQCLFAIQVYVHKLEHPQGVLGNVIDALCEGSIISDDAFLSWQQCTDPAEMMGHAVAVKALTSFFVNLRENVDESSEEA